MRRLIILSFVIAAALVTSGVADIVPPDRLAPWQGNVGVPGGIPNRTNIGATLDAAIYGNGITDATDAINAAINSCGIDQVVYLPPGTYLASSTLGSVYKSNYSIRGAGQGQTIIKWVGGANVVFQFGSADWPYPTTGVAINAGATRGSTVLTVPRNISMFPVGTLCHVTQQDLSYIRGNFPEAQTITFRVVANTATTVTLNHPLPCNFTNSPMLVAYPTLPTVGVGLESLTIDCNNLAVAGVQAEQMWGCWIKDVEIRRSQNRQMFLAVFNQSEIRHCYMHETYTLNGPNHEGIDFYNRGCWNLIEDNICENGGFPQIILGDWDGGNSCNVVAYNFCKNTATASPVAGADISFNHGAHNSFNLAEGNIVGNGISSDGYYGSSSHNTILRNWAAAKPYSAGIPASYTTTSGLRAIQLNRMSNYYNVIGNVLGDSSFSTAPGVGNYTSEASGYPEMQLIYQLGFPNLGNTFFTGTVGPQPTPDYTPLQSLPNGYQELDYNVKNTIIRHGNYDYYNQRQIWDPVQPDRTLPVSYYLSAKPAWFGELSWPPIDPAFPPTAFDASNVSKIPAGYRFVYGPALVTARSRKVHGTAGSFDIDLPLTGAPGIECRSGGTLKEHQIVIVFTTEVQSASASVTAGIGNVSGQPTMEGTEVTVNLTGVADAQTIAVGLTGTRDGGSFNVTIPISLLAGDVLGNGSVSASDIARTKSDAGQDVTNLNFRTDATANGAINAADIAFVRSKSGNSLH